MLLPNDKHETNVITHLRVSYRFSKVNNTNQRITMLTVDLLSFTSVTCPLDISIIFFLLIVAIGVVNQNLFRRIYVDVLEKIVAHHLTIIVSMDNFTIDHNFVFHCMYNINSYESLVFL
jgi:hypothetical protein